MISMDNPSPVNTLTCTQCGGELHPDEGQIFITCPYCSSTVYVDKSQVVFHWFLAPTLDEAKARASLARWMAGNQTVKDLDKKSTLSGCSFEYFPIWYFKQRLPNGSEQVYLEPAAALSISELKQIKITAGDLRKYDHSIEAQSRPPSVPLQAALQWVQQRQVPLEQIVERMLVHLPIYTMKYSYLNKPYTALIEGATGGVYANLYPAKAEAPYLMAGGITALVFLVLSLIPVIGYAIDSSSGVWIGLGVYLLLCVLAMPILFALAAWVAAKV